jgi:hypothetical protein
MQVHLAADSPVTALPYILAGRSLCSALHMHLEEVAATASLAEATLALGPRCKLRSLRSQLEAVSIDLPPPRAIKHLAPARAVS